MASKADPSIAGKRVLEERKKRRLTAEELADRVPDPSLTKTVITNLESGRKRDLTATELFQLASAMEISPLLLMLSPSRPFELVEIPGLAAPFSRMCVAEYLYTQEGLRVSDLSKLGRAKSLFGRLRDLEARVQRHLTIERHSDVLQDELLEDDASVALEGPIGVEGPDRVWVHRRDLSHDAFTERLRLIRSSAHDLDRFIANPAIAVMLAPDELAWLRNRIDRALARAKGAADHARLLGLDPEAETGEGIGEIVRHIELEPLDLSHEVSRHGETADSAK